MSAGNGTRRKLLRAVATGAATLVLFGPRAGIAQLAGPARALRPGAARAFLHPDCRRHQPGNTHPEQPARLDAALAGLNASGVAVLTPRAASIDDLLLCHTPAYVDLVAREVAAGATTLSTGDTPLSPGSLTAALAAAGSVIDGVDAVLAGTARTAFCAVRPPGHHASAARGMGFCIFNNVAIGARHALRRHGLERMLIVDWDVHHGNGTQDTFWRDGAVLFFDTHLDGGYPGTGAASERGEGKAAGLIINRPFPAGAGRAEILGAFRDTLLPAAERFRPQLVMLSAGFDSRAGDPLGRFTLSDRDFAELTDLTLDIADRHAGGRLVSVLEGGYHLPGLTSAIAAHVGRLAARG